MRGVFVSGTGTGVGKTHFTVALVRALRARGLPVRALKPVETGCAPRAEDADRLAAAAGRPELADVSGLLRLPEPLAPAAIPGPKPTIASLALRICSVAPLEAPLVVEGAGGLLVPYDDMHDFADLAVLLKLPLFLVAPNRLGVLHEVRATVEAAASRRLHVRAIVLSDVETPDLSAQSNASVLRRLISKPIIEWPRMDDAEAEKAIERLGVLGHLE
jgi:dethiobiotin synthetase